MTTKKQTAVEWLKKQLETYGSSSCLELDWQTLDELIEQAKQMEKDQMNNLIHFMRTQDKMGKSIEDLFEQYYNETYGKQTD